MTQNTFNAQQKTEESNTRGLQAGAQLIAGEDNACVVTLVLARGRVPQYLLTAGHVMPAEQRGLAIRSDQDETPIGTLYVNLLDQWPRNAIGLAYPYDAALIELNPRGREHAQRAARMCGRLAIHDVTAAQEGRPYHAWRPNSGKSAAVPVRLYPNRWLLPHRTRTDPVWVRDVIHAPPIMRTDYAGAPLCVEEQGRTFAVGLCVYGDSRRALFEPLIRILAACERIVGDISIF